MVGQTFGYRVLQLVASAAAVWLTAAWMGPALRGQTALVTALAHLAVLVSGFGAGSGLIYQATRRPSSHLAFWTVLWAGLATVLVWGVGWLYLEWTLGLSFSVALLGGLHAVLAARRGMALGQDRVAQDNLWGIWLAWLPVLMLGLAWLLGIQPSLTLFVGTQVLALLVLHASGPKPWTTSEFTGQGWLEGVSWAAVKATWTALWFQNRWSATANLFQFVATRIQYVFLLETLGQVPLGVYSVALVVAEALWMISRSYSTVLLASLSVHADSKHADSKHADSKYADSEQADAVRRTWRWSWRALGWTALGLLPLLLLPASVVQALLGQDYGDLPLLWLGLAPGILALSHSNVLVHHFTGLGSMRVAFVSSLGSAVLAWSGLSFALQQGGLVGLAWWSSGVWVVNAVLVAAYFWMQYRPYLWPTSR